MAASAIPHMESWSTPAYWFIAHGGFHPIPNHQQTHGGLAVPRSALAYQWVLERNRESRCMEMWDLQAAFADVCMNVHECSNKTCNNSSLNNPNSHGELQNILEKNTQKPSFPVGLLMFRGRFPCRGPCEQPFETFLAIEVEEHYTSTCQIRVKRELKPRLQNHLIKQEWWDVMHRRGMKWSSTGSLIWKVTNVTSSPANHLRSFWTWILSKRFPYKP